MKRGRRAPPRRQGLKQEGVRSTVAALPLTTSPGTGAARSVGKRAVGLGPDQHPAGRGARPSRAPTFTQSPLTV